MQIQTTEMQKLIQNTLKKLEIDNYLIHEEEAESRELFFIKKKLDMRRICNTDKYLVTVYHDFAEDGKNFRGSSDTTLIPGMDEEEVEKALADAYESAGYVKNAFYELYQGEKKAETDGVEAEAGIVTEGDAATDADGEETVKAAGKTSAEEISLKEATKVMAEALFAADQGRESWLNSAELFLVKTRTHIVGSTGTDVSYSKFECNGEFVAQSTDPQDVEQWFHFCYDKPDAAALTAKAGEALKTVRDRARAVSSPKSGEYDLILSEENLREILKLYLERANASSIYSGYSDYQIGTEVQKAETARSGAAGQDGESVQKGAVEAAEVTGEKLNLTLLPSEPYSYDGVPMIERPLITDGVLQTIYGTTRFCRYMNTEPTGRYEKIRLDNGTVKFDQLKKGCLYPVTFSDFQMDSWSGYFAGEIRLAYLIHEDGTTEVLTGGSVNGSLLEHHNNLTFSTERYSSADYEGPLAVRIPNVSVAGA